mmetsp:Transcript_8812/g.18775  ORF Transcript_8812/g.18775 Transcript_8812/m.18775 type:complete len:239 (+) Transcript_8812:820-1536(+)
MQPGYTDVVGCMDALLHHTWSHIFLVAHEALPQHLRQQRHHRLLAPGAKKAEVPEVGPGDGEERRGVDAPLRQSLILEGDACRVAPGDSAALRASASLSRAGGVARQMAEAIGRVPSGVLEVAWPVLQGELTRCEDGRGQHRRCGRMCPRCCRDLLKFLPAKLARQKDKLSCTCTGHPFRRPCRPRCHQRHGAQHQHRYNRCGAAKDRPPQSAWREAISLCACDRLLVDQGRPACAVR